MKIPALKGSFKTKNNSKEKIIRILKTQITLAVFQHILPWYLEAIYIYICILYIYIFFLSHRSIIIYPKT